MNEIQEAQTAILYAKLKAAYGSAGEPYDAPIEMIPVAYAMFRVMAEVCIGSGHDESAWWAFLKDALAECIHKAQEKAF